MGERGIEEEMEAIRGTWSEVSREREEREEGVPGRVDKESVETHKSRRVPAIGPRVLTITERELDKAEGIDAVIEQLRFRKIKVIVVPVSKGATEVEVPANKPRMASLGSWEEIEARKAGLSASEHGA
jgi:hypothetical protein